MKHAIQPVVQLLGRELIVQSEVTVIYMGELSSLTPEPGRHLNPGAMGCGAVSWPPVQVAKCVPSLRHVRWPSVHFSLPSTSDGAGE